MGSALLESPGLERQLPHESERCSGLDRRIDILVGSIERDFANGVVGPIDGHRPAV
jgi:hypothetical protein